MDSTIKLGDHDLCVKKLNGQLLFKKHACTSFKGNKNKTRPV